MSASAKGAEGKQAHTQNDVHGSALGNWHKNVLVVCSSSDRRGHVCRSDGFGSHGITTGSGVFGEDNVALKITTVYLELRTARDESSERRPNCCLSGLDAPPTSFRQTTRCRTDEPTLEPIAVPVVAAFLEVETLGLAIDTNLDFILEEVRHSREGCAAQGSASVQSPAVPATVVCQFLGGVGPGCFDKWTLWRGDPWCQTQWRRGQSYGAALAFS